MTAIRIPAGWNLFPYAIIAAMGVVVAVNGAMIWWALATFPGKTGRDGFDLSNQYNAVLSRVEDQAKLGWTARTAVLPDKRVAVTLTKPSGEPFPGAIVEGIAERPVGAGAPVPLIFQDRGTGRYLSDVALDLSGQWDVQLSVHAGAQALMTTQRVIVP